jgi:hypothetical protein
LPKFKFWSSIHVDVMKKKPGRATPPVELERGLRDVPRRPLEEADVVRHADELRILLGRQISPDEALQRLRRMADDYLAVRREAQTHEDAVVAKGLRGHAAALGALKRSLERYLRDSRVAGLRIAAAHLDATREPAKRLLAGIASEVEAIQEWTVKRERGRRNLKAQAPLLDMASGFAQRGSGQRDFAVRFALILALDGYPPSVAAMAEDVAVRSRAELRDQKREHALYSESSSVAKKRWTTRFRDLYRGLDQQHQKVMREAQLAKTEAWIPT